VKSKIFFSIILLGIVLIAGATLLKYSSFTQSTTDGTSITNPPNNRVPPAPNKYLVSVSAEDFTKEASIKKQVEVKNRRCFYLRAGFECDHRFQLDRAGYNC
jgi:hypothetical protein